MEWKAERFSGANGANYKLTLLVENVKNEQNQDYNVETNTSDVYAKLVMTKLRGTGYYNTSGSNTDLYVYIDSVKYEGKMSGFDFRNYTELILWEGYIRNIKHNSDGKKSIQVGASFYTGLSQIGSASVTGEELAWFDLPTIPRTSKLNNTGSFYIQDGFKLNFTSYSNSFRHRVKITQKGTNNVFLSITMDNGEQITFNNDLINTFIQSFPIDKNQSIFEVELLTYSDFNQTNLIGTDKKELIGMIKATGETVPIITGKLKTYEKNDIVLKLTNEERCIKDYSKLNVILDEIPTTKNNSKLDRVMLNDIYKMSIYNKTFGNNIEVNQNLNGQIITGDFFTKEGSTLIDYMSYEELYQYYIENKDRIFVNPKGSIFSYEDNLIPIIVGDEGENDYGPYGIYMFASDNPTLENGRLGIIIFGDIEYNLDYEGNPSDTSRYVIYSIGLYNGELDSHKRSSKKIRILNNFSNIRKVYKGSIYDRLVLGEGETTKQIAEYTINNVNTNIIKVEAFDSRNLSSSMTSSVEMITDYHIPLINNIQVNRTNGVEETVYLSFKATLWKGSFGNGNNTITECKYRVKKTSSSSYSDWFDITGEIKVAIENQEVDNLFISDIQLFSDGISANFDFGQEYDIELYIVDGITGTKFNSSGNIHVMLDDGLVLDDYVKNKDGYQVAINGMVNKSLENGLQIFGKLYVNDVEVTGGSGGGSSSVNVVDNLNSTSTTLALSANQGRILNQNKQEKLISGINIKTINNKSILGDGNINISGNFGENGSDTTPIGAILEYPSGIPPENWLICDGSAISRTEYSDLFEVIGTTYGSGNGSTTFNLPNKKGRVGVGLDTTQEEFNKIGKTGGEKTHKLTIDELSSHTHDMRRTYGTTQSSNVTANSEGKMVAGANENAWDWTYNQTNATGNDKPHNNLQPYIVTNFIIKVTKEISSSSVNEIYNAMWPIGRGFIDFTDTDYSSWLGFKWERELVGMTGVGLDTTQEEFNKIGKTGGSKYLQKHSHKISNAGYTGGTSGDAIRFESKLVQVKNYMETDETGVGGSGNLQPYKVIAYWKRVA